MSNSLSRLVHDTLLVKYFIHPVPKSLSQSMAIYSHFVGLSANPLIQYRHSRDASTGNKSHAFRVLFNDPLPSVDAQAKKFLVGSTTLETVDKSLDIDDHSDRISVWQNSRMTVSQNPFYDRLRKFSSNLEKNYTKELDINSLDNSTIKSLWDQSSKPYFPAATGTSSPSSILSSLSSEGTRVKPTIHLTFAKEASNDTLSVISPLEHSLLDTCHLIVDNHTNTIISFESFFKTVNANQRLLEVLQQEKLGFSNNANSRFTHFELSMRFMTRDPEAVTYAADLALLDKLKIPRSNSNSNMPLDIGQRAKALDRLRSQVLNGFTGSLEFKE